jgi:sugar phosphate isomerase/epimerase
MALDLLGPHLHHVHLKNARISRSPGGRRTSTWTALDEGVADVGGFLGLLDEIGYDRWVSIEDLSDGADSSRAIRANAAALTALDAPDWFAPTRHEDKDLHHAG